MADAKRSKPAAVVLGNLASAVYAQIYAMTPRQRRAALRALDRMNDRNCGWTAYRMRAVLRDFVAEASSARAKVRRKA